MKKIYSTRLVRIPQRTLAYLLLSMLFASVLFYSCRKMNFVPPEDNTPKINPAAVITKNDLMAWYDDLPIEDQNGLTAATGLVSGYGKVPFPLQWEKAQQRILNGKHVVRVPINNTALLVFEKEGDNGPLIAYSYKWQPNTNKGSQYSGDVIRFSFQDYSVVGLEFQKSQRTAAFTFPNARPLDLDQLKSVKEVLRTQKAGNKFKINTLKSNSFLSFLGAVLTAIVDVVHAAGCTITNQNYTWSQGNIVHDPLGPDPTDTYTAGECNGHIFEFHAREKDPNAPPSSTPGNADGELQDNIGGGGFMTIGGSFGSGGSSGGDSSGGDSSGGGGGNGGMSIDLSTQFWSKFNQMTGGNYGISSPSYSPPPAPTGGLNSTESAAVIALFGTGNLTANQIYWLSEPTNGWALDVKEYLGTSPTTLQLTMAKKHIDMSMGATPGTYGYLQLAKDYAEYRRSINFGVGVPVMWWENSEWLSNPTNLKHALDYIESQELFEITTINFPAELSYFNKNTIKDAIANGVTATAELVHKMYMQADRYLYYHYDQIEYINNGLRIAKFFAKLNTNFDIHTMNFKDLVLIWLFELGDTSHFYFGNGDVTTNRLRTEEGVTTVRNMAISKIRNGDLSSTYYYWTYGQPAFWNGVTEANITTSFTGSYPTTVTVTNNNNGTYTLHFSMQNTTGWESGTRLRKDNDGIGGHDGIIPNKVRGAGIKLGGNIIQDWNWTEVITP